MFTRVSVLLGMLIFAAFVSANPLANPVPDSDRVITAFAPKTGRLPVPTSPALSNPTHTMLTNKSALILLPSTTGRSSSRPTPRPSSISRDIYTTYICRACAEPPEATWWLFRHAQTSGYTIWWLSGG
ncbi:hypothetical protein K438DRAFT_1764809 [Mycena galopus ATCC 62051]|nr:hypothetical protein K438DRAFT_1764809 [Mycena galopus ATCC 62051]